MIFDLSPAALLACAVLSNALGARASSTSSPLPALSQASVAASGRLSGDTVSSAFKKHNTTTSYQLAIGTGTSTARSLVSQMSALETTLSIRILHNSTFTGPSRSEHASTSNSAQPSFSSSSRYTNSTSSIFSKPATPGASEVIPQAPLTTRFSSAQHFTLQPSLTASGNLSALILGSSTIYPGGPAYILGSHTISLLPSGLVNVGSSTETLRGPFPTPEGITETITTFPPDMSTQTASSGTFWGNTWLTTSHQGHHTTAAVINGTLIWFPHAWKLHTHYQWKINGKWFRFHFDGVPCIEIPVLHIALTPGCKSKPPPPVNDTPEQGHTTEPTTPQSTRSPQSTTELESSRTSSSSSCSQTETATECRATCMTVSPSGRSRTTSCFTTTCSVTTACSVRPYTTTSLVSNTTTSSSTSSTASTCMISYTINDITSEYAAWGAALPFGYQPLLDAVTGIEGKVSSEGPSLPLPTALSRHSGAWLITATAPLLTGTGALSTKPTSTGTYTNSTANPGGIIASLLGNSSLLASLSTTSMSAVHSTANPGGIIASLLGNSSLLSLLSTTSQSSLPSTTVNPGGIIASLLGNPSSRGSTTAQSALPSIPALTSCSLASSSDDEKSITSCECNEGAMALPTSATLLSGTTYLYCGLGSYTTTFSTAAPIASSTASKSSSAVPTPNFRCSVPPPMESPGLPINLCFAQTMAHMFCSMPQDVGLNQHLGADGHIQPYTVTYPFVFNPDSTINSTLWMGLSGGGPTCDSSVIAPPADNGDGQGTDQFCLDTLMAIINNCDRNSRTEKFGGTWVSADGCFVYSMFTVVESELTSNDTAYSGDQDYINDKWGCCGTDPTNIGLDC